MSKETLGDEVGQGTNDSGPKVAVRRLSKRIADRKTAADNLTKEGVAAEQDEGDERITFPHKAPRHKPPHHAKGSSGVDNACKKRKDDTDESEEDEDAGNRIYFPHQPSKHKAATLKSKKSGIDNLSHEGEDDEDQEGLDNDTERIVFPHKPPKHKRPINPKNKRKAGVDNVSNISGDESEEVEDVDDRISFPHQPPKHKILPVFKKHKSGIANLSPD
eukprot:g17571.t1